LAARPESLARGGVDPTACVDERRASSRTALDRVLDEPRLAHLRLKRRGGARFDEAVGFVFRLGVDLIERLVEGYFGLLDFLAQLAQLFPVGVDDDLVKASQVVGASLRRLRPRSGHVLGSRDGVGRSEQRTED